MPYYGVVLGILAKPGRQSRSNQFVFSRYISLAKLSRQMQTDMCPEMNSLTWRERRKMLERPRLNLDGSVFNDRSIQLHRVSASIYDVQTLYR